jgi:conjugative relaxase-like TrwC/TraI family protein
VLTLAKVKTDSAAPYAEYLISRMQSGAGDRGDYYLNKHGRQEAPGRWVLGPRGRELLGVEADRPVSQSELRNLLAVRFPGDPERELRPAGANGRAVAAIDATFSAPKSVSVVWALGSEETRQAIEEAHERAVDAALAHAVEHVPMLRRRVDRETVVRERAGELVASVFRHTTARAVDGQVPDPQLHSHVLLHGAVRPGEAKIAAIESRALMVHQRELAAMYRAVLADGLRDLAYAIERNTGRDDRYFEIEGVPQAAIEEFSGRHRQVRERIEWRKQERLYGLRELSEQDGERGAEARRRLARLEAELAERHGRERDEIGAYEYLERIEGLQRLAGRLDAVGERARAKLTEIERYGDRLSPAQERVVAKESRAPKGLETHGDLDQRWGERSRAHGFDSRDSEALRGRPGQRPDRRALVGQLERALTAHRATFADREARAAALEVACSSRDGAGLLDELVRRGELVALEQGRFTTRRQRGLERHALRWAGELAAGRVDPVPQVFVDAELARLRAEFDAVGGLAPEQEAAVRLACSDRRLVLIEGQAGTGKSTALIAAARAEQLGGRRVVVTSTGGQAADRLAGELRAAGVSAEGYSTKALEASVEHGLVRLGPDTSVIHEECALAATREQNFLFWACQEGGARLVEVGDPEQNNPVGAGGLIGRLERLAKDQDAFVALERIVRARAERDREMQRALRGGDTAAALENLERRGRVLVASTRAEAAQTAAELWDRLREEAEGALVLTEAGNEQVDELNAQLQAIRFDAGELGPDRLEVPGRPYVLRRSDLVVVRAQFEHAGVGVVRNGERGTVAAVEGGRALLDFGAGRRALLDADGIREADVRLAYAQHSNPAQGATTGHAIDLFGAVSTRRGQYVALTRGRQTHWLVTSYDDLEVELAEGRAAALAALSERMARDEPELPSVAFAELATRTSGREDALRLVGRVVGRERVGPVAEQVRQGPDSELAKTSVEDLARRARELRDLLDDFPCPDPRTRIAGERAERLRAELSAQRARLDASVAQLDPVGPLRRRERAELRARIGRHRRAIAATEASLAELAAASERGGDPDRWARENADGLAEYVHVEAELGARFAAEYERALRRVRVSPRAELVRRLGQRPVDGVARELWEHQAVRLELHRAREGELPETSAEALDLHEWRTAPAELVRTNPDRPELPAAERVLPEFDDESFDLGP